MRSIDVQRYIYNKSRPENVYKGYKTFIAKVHLVKN